MAATIVDVARLAGVGTTTVTKVPAGRPYVSAATRLRVLEAAAALDYYPSRAGRVLRTGVPRVLGVSTPPPAAMTSCGSRPPHETRVRPPEAMSRCSRASASMA
jgi:DNA-binding LacI/PurR family transcriptional regulator